MNVVNITFLGLFLTIIALLLSIWQLVAARKQTKKLTLITDVLSTKHLGAYPEFVLEIGNLISKAQKQILIACNFPAYGVFNSNEGWLSIKYTLEKAFLQNQNMKVTCVFANKSNRKSWLIKQFNEAKVDWINWRSNPEQKEKLQHFLTKYGKGEAISELSFDGFIDLFEEAADLELGTTYKQAEKIELPHRPPLYMWVVDSKEAIFAISTNTPTFFGEAFWTTEPRLISALINMHHEYQNSVVNQ